MTSQKLENLLNLALNSAEDEREKSLNLNVGYDPLDREWDLIIKYSVNLDRVRKIASKVTELTLFPYTTLSDLGRASCRERV